MDVKTITLIFLGSFRIQASIFGVAADKISEKDKEVPKLMNQGNHLDETAEVRELSLKNVILQKRMIKEDIKEKRIARRLKGLPKPMISTCGYEGEKCKDDSDCCEWSEDGEDSGCCCRGSCQYFHLGCPYPRDTEECSPL